jgi:2-haloacid dehalogenase
VNDEIRACLFDVFGTVVDWQGGVARELAAVADGRGLTGVDWLQFAKDWRAMYSPSMEPIRRGTRPFVVLDVLHRESLVTLLGRYGITGLRERDVDEMNLAWHRLDPWPDAVEGVARLKRRYIVAPCSNGNVALIVDMAKRAGLPWDAVLGAEPTRSYKPAPEAYLGSCRMLGVAPAATVMVAAHHDDLRAARACGLRTAFVPRPTERDQSPGGAVDFVAPDFAALADALGC